jgi:hypothetical protein
MIIEPMTGLLTLNQKKTAGPSPPE